MWSDILSGMCSEICPAVKSNMWHVLWHTLQHVLLTRALASNLVLMCVLTCFLTLLMPSNLPFVPTCVLTYAPTFVLTCGLSDVCSVTYSDIFFCVSNKCSAICYDMRSGMCLACILTSALTFVRQVVLCSYGCSDMCFGVSFGIYSYTCSDICLASVPTFVLICDMCFGMNCSWNSVCHMAGIGRAACSLASFPACILASTLTFYLTLFLPSILPFLLARILSCFLTFSVFRSETRGPWICDGSVTAECESRTYLLTSAYSK